MSQSHSCVICDLVAGCLPRWIVHETESPICFLPLDLNVYGHTILAPKEHFADLCDIPDMLLQELALISKQLAAHYRTAIGATGVNLLHASGVDAQQSVLHFHWHLLPRFSGDGLDAWPPLPVVSEDKDALLSKLRLDANL